MARFDVEVRTRSARKGLARNCAPWATFGRVALLALVSSFLIGCKSEPTPGLSMKDAQFAEAPVLIERSGHVYLHYRRALEASGPTLLALLEHKKSEDAAYYFFSIPISHPEWGNVIERPLEYDQTEDLARKGRVFWLDPDGTKHPIPMRTDTGSHESIVRGTATTSEERADAPETDR